MIDTIIGVLVIMLLHDRLDIDWAWKFEITRVGAEGRNRVWGKAWSTSMHGKRRHATTATKNAWNGQRNHQNTSINSWQINATAYQISLLLRKICPLLLICLRAHIPAYLAASLLTSPLDYLPPSCLPNQTLLCKTRQLFCFQGCHWSFERFSHRSWRGRVLPWPICASPRKLSFLTW